MDKTETKEAKEKAKTEALAAKEKAKTEKLAAKEKAKVEREAAREAEKVKIDPATRKKGEDLGFTFSATKAKVTVTKDDVIYGVDADPKEALSIAIENQANNKPFTKTMTIPEDYRKRYAGNGESCGDDMALALKKACTKVEKTPKGKDKEVLDVDAMNKVAKANNVDMSKYDHLNVGQRRMNLGNRLRGLLKAGTDVKVGTETFKAEDQPV